ncbi:hypothetical protein F5B17DRAFT_228070 [Nemania serpens]|nr:hypothetical protein F5B17DRAFT_228070 [Nemania serpens]
MVGIAQPYGVHPDKLAYRQLLLSLTSIQTTIIAFTHATYDLRAHGQCFEPLRSEIQGTLGREDWEKVEIHQMRSLESFLKEFRRVNPPSLLAFEGLVTVPLKLSDGTVLPPGTHFCMASHAILHGADQLPGGDNLDGFGQPLSHCYHCYPNGE